MKIPVFMGRINVDIRIAISVIVGYPGTHKLDVRQVRQQLVYLPEAFLALLLVQVGRGVDAVIREV